jgi:hypothetical protein
VDFTGAVSVDLPIAASVKVRFNFTNANYAWYWQVDELRVEVTSSTPLPPSAPGALAVSSIAANQVSLKWKDKSTDETGFKLEGSADGSTGWTQIGLFAANAVTGDDGTILCATIRYYRVSAVNATGVSTPSNTVSATTTACPPSAPTAPSGMTAAWSAPNINLTWTDNSTTETGFKLQWSANGASGWTELSRPVANATSAVDSAVPCGATRYYRVIAYTASGDSAPSPAASASAAACPPPAPTAPSGLTAALSGSSINLAWTDNSNSETSFKVERSTNAGSTWSQVTVTAANAVSYADSSLTCGTRYAYRVRAANANGDSAYSSAAESMSATCPPPAPAAPSGLTAVLSSSSINLTWTDNSTTETGFKVERSANAGSTWSQIFLSAANAVSYSDSGLTCGTTYVYRVRASNATGDSANSSTASASAVACKPAAPSGLSATLSGSSINLAWTDNSANETGFKVERSANAGGTWAQLTLTAANATTYSDSSLTCGTSYTYRVTATNAGGDSDPSPSASASAAGCPPAAPSGLTAVLSGVNINLAWTDNSANETGFKVERSANAGATWSQITLTAANAVSYIDTNLTCGAVYYYRVRAANANGDSDPSPSANASAPVCLPSAPSGLTATLSSSSINLAWKDNSADESGFKVERSLNAGGTWTQITLTATNAVSYVDSSLACGVLFTYRVRATNAAGDSNPSPTASASAPACPPSPSATPTASRTPTATATRTATSTPTATFTPTRTPNPTATPTLTPIPSSTPTATATSIPTATATSYPKQTSLSESFTNGSLPAGWTLLPASGSAAWAFNNPGARTNRTGGTGGFAIIDSDKAGYFDVNAELRTPPMDLSAHTVVKLIYRQYFYFYSNSTADVDYSIDGGGTWTNISTKTGATVSGEVTVLVPGAAGQSNVVFRFRYYNANYAWYWQLDDVRVPGAIEAGAPMPPSAVAAALNGADATVSWTDNSPNETGFVIERSIDSGTSWVEAGRTGPNATTFNDPNLTCGLKVLYRAKAIAGASSSEFSGTSSSIATQVCPATLTSLNEDFNSVTYPAIPAGWIVQGIKYDTINGLIQIGATGNSIHLNNGGELTTPALNLSSYTAVKLFVRLSLYWWNFGNSDKPLEGDIIVISTDGGETWTKAWSSDQDYAGILELDITPQAAGKPNVLIRLQTTDKGGSDPGLEIDDVKVEALPVPSTPYPLVVTQIPEGVLLGWDGSISSTFMIQRSTDNSTWDQIAEVTDQTNSYIDRTTVKNTTYYYRVIARNAAGESAPSAAAAITTEESGIRDVPVTISLYQGAPINTPAERAKYEEILKYFADALYESSNGAFRLGAVTIYRDGRNWSSANLQWSKTCWPAAVHGGFSGARGVWSVYMCDNFEFEEGVQNFLDDPVDGGGTIAHEWGHYFFCLFDEYEIATGDVPAEYSIMNQSDYGATDKRWWNFSTSMNYSALTNQGRIFGASGWDTLIRSPKQDPVIAGLTPRLYWPELAKVAPAAGQLPAIEITQPGEQEKARAHLQIIWSPAFPSANPSSSPQNMLSVANGIVREIVVDTSSWMTNANALEETKTALAALISQVPDGDVLGLITYDGSAAVSSALTPITSQAARDALIAKVTALAGGASASNPGAGLQAALTALTAVNVPQESDRVVYWITTGHASTGDNPTTLVDDFTGSRIPLWIYGFSPEAGDQAKLQLLADLTGGSYTAVNDSASLQKAFELGDQDTSPVQDTMLKWSGWVMDRGTSAAEDVVVDASLGQVDFQMSYDGPAADLTLAVTDPDNYQYDVDPANDCETTDAGTVDEFTTCTLTIPNPAAGIWTILSTETVRDTYFMYYVNGVAVAGGSTFTANITFPDGKVAVYPQPIRVEAMVQNDYPIAGLNVVGYVFDPDGNGTEIQFRDDGVAPDGTANDGVYSAYAGYASDGEYWVAVQFDNAAGTAFYTDKGLMTKGSQTLPAISEDFERYAEEQATVTGWKPDDHADWTDDPAVPPTELTLDNTPIYGMIDFENDSDTFKITVPDSLTGPYALRINRLGLGMDPYVYVYAEDGSWEFDRYFDFTPDSGDSLFIPLDLIPGQNVIVMVFHYDETAVGGVYAVSAGNYQVTDPTSAFARSKKPNSHDLFLPAVKR